MSGASSDVSYSRTTTALRLHHVQIFGTLEQTLFPRNLSRTTLVICLGMTQVIIFWGGPKSARPDICEHVLYASLVSFLQLDEKDFYFLFLLNKGSAHNTSTCLHFVPQNRYCSLFEAFSPAQSIGPKEALSVQIPLNLSLFCIKTVGANSRSIMKLYPGTELLALAGVIQMAAGLKCDSGCSACWSDTQPGVDIKLYCGGSDNRSCGGLCPPGYSRLHCAKGERCACVDRSNLRIFPHI